MKRDPDLKRVLATVALIPAEGPERTRPGRRRGPQAVLRLECGHLVDVPAKTIPQSVTCYTCMNDRMWDRALERFLRTVDDLHATALELRALELQKGSDR